MSNIRYRLQLRGAKYHTWFPTREAAESTLARASGHPIARDSHGQYVDPSGKVIASITVKQWSSGPNPESSYRARGLVRLGTIRVSEDVSKRLDELCRSRDQSKSSVISALILDSDPVADSDS
jgi:hypothetical protein